MLKGIDISTFQKNVNWKKVRNSEIAFVILRIGYTGYGAGKNQAKDELFESHYIGATSWGIPVGGYFFGRAVTAAEGRKEAEYVLKTIKGKTFNYPIFYDTEDTYYQAKNSKQGNTDAVTAFCDTIKSAGYKTGVYASKSWFADMLDDNRLTKYSHWIAQYNSQCTYKGKYDMWQYTSTGKVDGISGNVDLNYCYKDYLSAKPTESTIETDNFLPARGYFKKGDKSPNVGKIASFMRKVFPAYTSKKALGNTYGPYLIEAIKEFQRRTGLEPDGCTGPLTLAQLQKYGFKK